MKKIISLLAMAILASACSGSGSGGSNDPLADFPSDLAMTINSAAPLTPGQEQLYNKDTANGDVLSAVTDIMPEQILAFLDLKSNSGSSAFGSHSPTRTNLSERIKTNCDVEQPDDIIPTATTPPSVGEVINLSGHGSIDGVSCPVTYVSNAKLNMTVQAYNQDAKILKVSLDGTEVNSLNFMDKDEVNSLGFISDTSNYTMSGRMAQVDKADRVEIQINVQESVTRTDGSTLQINGTMHMIVAAQNDGSSNVVMVANMTTKAPTYTAELALKLSTNNGGQPTILGNLNGRDLSTEEALVYLGNASQAGSLGGLGSNPGSKR